MFSRLKYVVYQIGTHETFIIFPEWEQHNDMVSRLLIAPNLVKGAGFVNFVDDTPECYGDSVSLDIKSRKEDTILMMKATGKDE